MKSETVGWWILYNRHHNPGEYGINLQRLLRTGQLRRQENKWWVPSLVLCFLVLYWLCFRFYILNYFNFFFVL